MKLEQTMSQVLSEWSDATVRDNTLLLRNETHTLVFTQINVANSVADKTLKSPVVGSRFNKGEVN